MSRKPVRVEILEEGARITGVGREASYGPPNANLTCAGELKAVFRKHLRRKLTPAEQEALDMVLTKLGRVATSPAPVRDTYVDGAAYFAIAGEMALDLS